MWADIVAWWGTAAGIRVVQGAVVPALAILVAGVVAALIGRGALRSAIAAAERERATTAVAGLVEAARASVAGVEGGGDRRRIARLRTESDVRVRMLALPGAPLAATWAAERTDEAVALAAAGADGDEAVGRLRDALVEWVARPKRARRLFAAAPSVPGPRRTAQEAPPAAVAADPQKVTSPPPPPPPAAPPAPPATDERADDQDFISPDLETAPVLVQRTRGVVPASAQPQRPAAVVATAPEPVEAPVPEARPARHARPAASTPAGITPEAAPAGEPAATPSWLDTYDDEAQVTQNMNLKTPPPVAASAIRDRAPSGTEIVPRA